MTEIKIRYQTPGKGWKTKSFRTEREMERFIEKLDDDVEVRIQRDS